MESYPGGKNGNGTYQSIINHIPPHDFYFEGFAGSAAIYRHLKPAANAILCDLSSSQISIIKSFLLPSHIAINIDVISRIDYIVNFLTFLQNSGKRVFAYFDPPYLFDVRSSQKKIYTHEITLPDHIALLQAIGQAKFPCMISCYNHSLYSSMLEHWYHYSFPSMTRHGLRTETIYFNYPTPVLLHDYSYIGSNFREREKLSRIRINFIRKLNAMSPILKNSIVSSIRYLQ